MTYKKPWVYNPRLAEERIVQLERENEELKLEIDRLRELNNQFRIRLRIEEDNGQ